MNIKPILFSTPMVQAILAGRKTMTRRVIKPSEKWVEKFEMPMCRYKPGDILWVRETWQHLAPWSEDESHVEWEKGKYYYAADGTTNITITDGDGFRKENFTWRPSIFMPRDAARIWLRVTTVRAEKLQDITEEDAIAEGLRIGIGGAPYFSCRDAFAALWDSLNAKRGYGWDTNPWVWVIGFERILKEAEHDG